MPGVPSEPDAHADVTIAIEFSPRAQRMLEDADEHWAAEHPLDDNPLLDEVSRAADLLRDMPELGIIYRRDLFRREIRRMLLRLDWHLYYIYEPDRSRVVIVAVWYARRGGGPPL